MDERPVINISVKHEHEVSIPIMDGDKELTTLVFNPYDMTTLSNYFKVYDLTHKGSKRQKELEIELGNLDKEYGADLLERELSDVEEFEQAAMMIHKQAERFTAAMDTFDEVVAGLDAVFGEGICDLFLTAKSGKKYRDIEMLDPLIEGTKPFFDEAGKDRRDKVDKYKEAAKEMRDRRLHPEKYKNA